jgi:hypothetical protein
MGGSLNGEKTRQWAADFSPMCSLWQILRHRL